MFTRGGWTKPRSIFMLDSRVDFLERLRPLIDYPREVTRATLLP